MNQRITSLSFIIGLFFFLVSLILLTGYFVSKLLANVINLYAGIAFLIFGLAMISVRQQKDAG